MSPAAQSLLDRLDEMRSRWWLFSMLCNVVLVILVSLAILVTFILADVLVRLPQFGLAAMLFVWIAATAGLGLFTVYRTLRRQRSLEATARRVELSYPELGSNLINLVQLASSSNGTADDFREAAIADAVHRTSDVPIQRAAQRQSRWQRWRLGVQTSRDLLEFAAALLLLFCLIALFSSWFPKWASSAERLFSPWQFVPQVGEVEIVEVTPGNAQLLAGSRMEVQARIKNPKHEHYPASIYVMTADGNETSQDMFPGESFETYTFTFPAVLEPMRYRLEIGDSQSEVFDVEIRRKPTVTDVEITYDFPDYLEREDLVVQQKHADLEAPQFTVAHLKLTSSSRLSKAFARRDGKESYAQVSKNGRTVSLDIPMARQGSYTVHLFNDAGHTDSEPRVNLIRVIPDAPPVVQVIKPLRESTSAPGSEVPVVLRASDDHGLGEVRLEIKVADEDGAQADQPATVLQTWSDLAAASATTLSYPFKIDSTQYRIGQTILLRATAVDRRNHGSARPQDTSSSWHRIRLVDPAKEAEAKITKLESLNAKLWAILQSQIRARIITAKLEKEDDEIAAMNSVGEVRQRQVRIQIDSAEIADSINTAEEPTQRDLKQALSKLAHGEMLVAVKKAEALGKLHELHEIAKQLPPIIATQDNIIDILRRLLELTRREMSKTLANMEDRRGGDLPDEVADKLRDLKQKLGEFVEQQKRVIEATKSLAKKPVDDFTEEDEQLLKDLAAIEDDWARFLEEAHSDFSKLPEQDFANPSMLQELVEVQTEIKMAKDALTKKSADIAVPLEQLGAEMAEEITTNLEKWLPDTPDRERWSQEEPLTDEMKEAPMAELPGELEDLVGELMEEEEDLFDEMEDVSSSWADSLDKGAGWDTADGPISNMSAKGATGNRLPNTSEIGGRSGEGRQGKSSGEFVGDTAVGKGGRKTPSRLNPDPFVKGQVKDFSKDPTGGATGGGKESGVGGEGLEGPVPQRPQREMQRLANKQAELRNRAESVDVKFKVMNYHHTDLNRMIDAMAAVERDLRSGRYKSALRKREILLDGLGSVKTYLDGEFQIRQDQTTNLPGDIQRDLLNGMQEASPDGWEELNRKYFESLANQEQPGAEENK